MSKNSLPTMFIALVLLLFSTASQAFFYNPKAYYTCGQSPSYPPHPSIGLKISNAIGFIRPRDDISQTSVANNEHFFYQWGATKKIIAGSNTYVFKPLLGYAKPNNKKVMYIHGGAFTQAITWDHVAMLWDLANRSGSEIYVPMYTLADRAHYPVQRDGLLAVYNELSKRFGSNKLILSGDSAGGNLALSLLTEIRKQGLDMPEKAILISPWMDLSLEHPLVPFTYDPFLSKPILLKSSKKYLGGNYNVPGFIDQEGVSPVNIEDFTGFPPMFYFIGTSDLFYPDSLNFKHDAEVQGVELTFAELPIGIHVTPVASPILVPESLIVRDQIATYINCPVARKPSR